MEAKRFLESVVSAYGGLSAYQDRGRVRVTSPRSQNEDEFATYFKRPSTFRFDFLSTLRDVNSQPATIYRAILLKDADAFAYQRAFDADPATTREDSIGLAVAKLTGISAGAAYVIPRLLLDNLPGISILEFQEPRFDDDIVVSGVQCKQVHCMSPIGQCTLAVEEESLMIRRIINLCADVEMEESRFDIRIDCLIDERLFDAPFVELLM